MTNKILLLILSVCLISFTSAIYPGETMIVEHNLTGRLFWNITENTSELSVMPDGKVVLIKGDLRYDDEKVYNIFKKLDANIDYAIRIIHTQ